MMRKLLRVAVLLLVLLPLSLRASEDVKTMEQMVNRLFPQHSTGFEFIQKAAGDKDYFEIQTIGNKLVVTGNNANSMAVGLNYYLKYYCKTSVSWYLADAVDMPTKLPKVANPIASETQYHNRFFLNYCTFGYTMPWWRWQDWERFIDWMALNGVNMPLAITGQEKIWYNVWTKLGLTDEEVRNYFTGPAHLPWHRMTNIDYWQGGLPHEWLDNQEALQKQILERERAFNMKPILPAFAGHVPIALKRLHPEAKISRMSSWGGFRDEYKSFFLDPLDPLFPEIQKAFLEEQIELFGTDHIYGVDPFNEIVPPSWEPDFLATCSRYIYKSITDVDPDATWLQMTWLFYFSRNNWTNERIEAFLKAVPQDKMILLDYYCENKEVWSQTESYFGQPYIWCYLGNFGGNTMLAGNFHEVSKRLDNVFKNGGDNLWGVGSTLEAFDVNPFMYEYMFERIWDFQVSDKEWVDVLADRRLGKSDKNYRKAWQLLIDSVYVSPAMLGQGTLTNSRPTLKSYGTWTTNPTIHYSNKVLLEVWENLLKPGKQGTNTQEYDVTNIARQTLSNYFMQMRDEFTALYEAKDVEGMLAKGRDMKQLLRDMDRLLGSQHSMLLGKWLNDARSFGHNEHDKAYYENNARTLITTWGEKGQSLNDYGNRSWAGLTESYYLPRWSLFIDSAINAVKAGKEFNQAAFKDEVTSFEENWTRSTAHHTSYPEGDSYAISKELFQKYKNQIKGK